MMDALTTNKSVLSWIEDKVNLVKPDKIVWIDGSEAQLDSLRKIAVETGELINIDGNGNRVASSLYGHKKVWFIVGRNKLAPTYEEALWRARNIAAPKNAQRLGWKTPCAAREPRSAT